MASESSFLRFHGTWTMIKRFTHTARSDVLHTSLREQLLSRKAPATVGHIRPLLKVWTVHSCHGQQGTSPQVSVSLKWRRHRLTHLYPSPQTCDFYLTYYRRRASICHSTRVEVRGHLYRVFLSTFTWVPRIEFGMSGLCGRHFYLLSHLASTYFIFETMSLYEAQAGLKLDLASWVMKLPSCRAYWTLFSFFFFKLYFEIGVFCVTAPDVLKLTL